MKQILIISLMVVLLTSCAPVVASDNATPVRTLDVSMVVLEGPREIKFYDPVSGAEILQSIQVAGVQRGRSISYSMRMVNSGVETLHPLFTTNPYPVTWGTVNVSNLPSELVTGQSANITVTFNVSANATIGQQEPFEIMFYEVR